VIERVSSKSEIRSAVAGARRAGKTVGFVPTMGALHEGHLSLVRAACGRTDYVVASIFVNPTQFSPGEDFGRYPRRVEADIEILSAEGLEAVFTPSVETMYGAGAQVTVDPGPLAERWEGEIRPGHFAGMATVVAKLLGIVQPDLAFFGEKDYQQLRIIERMVFDLDIPVGIVGCPIVRAQDGLALSSRNAYLSAEERAVALALPEALDAAAAEAARGERDGGKLTDVMRQTVRGRGGELLTLDYAAIVDPATLEPLTTLDAPGRAIIAGRVGPTRLIDNREIVPSGGGIA
jgi:pantoate--beta-alanine ligase